MFTATSFSERAEILPLLLVICLAHHSQILPKEWRVIGAPRKFSKHITSSIMVMKEQFQTYGFGLKAS